MTTLSLNYEWRSLVTAALISYYRSDDEIFTAPDNEDRLAALLDDLYD